MPDFIEIILLARDMASKNVEQAAGKIEGDLAKMKAEAAASGAAFDLLTGKTKHTGAAMSEAEKALDAFSRKLGNAGKVVREGGRGFDDAGKAINQLGFDLEKAGGHAKLFGEDVGRAGSGMERLVVHSRGVGGALRDISNSFRLLRSEMSFGTRDIEKLDAEFDRFKKDSELLGAALAHDLVRGLEGFSRAARDGEKAIKGLFSFLKPVRDGFHAVEVGIQRMQATFQGAFHVVEGFGKALVQMVPGLNRLSGHFGQLGQQMGAVRQSFSQFTTAIGQTITSIGGLIGKLGFMGIAIAAAPFAIEGLSGAVVALGGSIVSLSGALSTLSAGFVALPAAIGGAAGAMAAFMTILKPATTGILQYVSAQQKIDSGQTPAPGGGGGGGGGAAQAQAIQQQQQQVRAAEAALRNARINAAQAVKAAEQNLANTRANAVLALIRLEQQLQNLRDQNAQKQKQLEAAVQDARAAAAAEAARGGGEQALAGAFVGEAQGQLASFQVTARAQEQNLVSQQARQRVASLRAIQAAQQQLQNAQINGAQAIAAAERNLAQQRLQATRAQQAATGAALGEAQRLYQNLSPLQKQVADNILALEKRWHNMGSVVSARNSFLKEILRDIRAINTNLPLIARDVAGFANLITGVVGGVRGTFFGQGGRLTGLGSRVFGGGGGSAADRASGITSGGGFLGFTQRQGQLLAGTGQGAGGGALAGLQAVIRLTTSAPAREFLHFLAEAANHIGRLLLRAEKTSEASGGLQRFFDHAQSIFRILGHTIGNVFTALKNVGEIGFPQGRGLLKSLELATKHFREFTESAKGRREIHKFFEDADAASRSLGRFVGRLAADLGLLGRDSIRGGNQSGFVKFVDTMTHTLGPLTRAIQHIVTDLGPDLFKLFQDLGPVIKSSEPVLKIAVKALDDFVKLIDWGIKHIPAFKDFIGVIAAVVVAKRITAVGAGFRFVGDMAKLAFGVLRTIASVIVETVVPAIEAMVGSEAVAEAASGALAFAMDAIPFVAIGLAVAALAYLIYKHWDTIKRVSLELWHAVERYLGKLWDAAKRLFRDGLNFVEKHWQDIVTFLVGGPVGLLYLILRWTGLWGKIQDVLSAAWTWIKNKIVSAWNGIVNFFTNTAPNALANAFGSVWDAVENAAVSAINRIINTINSLIGGIIDGVNWVLDKIGVSKIGKFQIPPIPTGGSNHAGSSPATTTGGAGGYMMPLHGGGLFFAEGGMVPGPEGLPQQATVHGGEVVLNRAQQAVVGEDRIKRALFNPVSAVTGAVSGVAHGIASLGLDALKAILPSIPNVPGMFGTLVHGFGHFLEDKVLGWAEHELGSIFGGGGSPNLKNPGGSGGGYAPGISPYAPPPGLSAPMQVLAKWVTGHGGIITSTTGGTHAPGSYHYLGEALDIGYPQGNVVNLWASLLHSARSFAELFGPTALKGGGLYHFGNRFADAALQAEHQNHVHVAFLGTLQQIYRLIGQAFKFAPRHRLGGIVGYQPGAVPNGPITNIGDAMPIIAHVGEWILNEEQQMRVAQAFGGLDRARSAIFQGKAYPSGYAYAGGGVVRRRRGGAVVAGSHVEQHFTINTTSPKVDIEYVARVAQQRMAHTP